MRSMWNQGTVSVVTILCPLSQDACWHHQATVHLQMVILVVPSLLITCLGTLSSTIKNQPQLKNIHGKLFLEHEAADVGVTIKSYHSDNGIFSSDEFKWHCGELNQELTFSGVGARFQVSELCGGTSNQTSDPYGSSQYATCNNVLAWL